MSASGALVKADANTFWQMIRLLNRDNEMVDIIRNTAIPNIQDNSFLTNWIHRICAPALGGAGAAITQSLIITVLDYIRTGHQPTFVDTTPDMLPSNRLPAQLVPHNGLQSQHTTPQVDTDWRTAFFALLGGVTCFSVGALAAYVHKRESAAIAQPAHVFNMIQNNGTDNGGTQNRNEYRGTQNHNGNRGTQNGNDNEGTQNRNENRGTQNHNGNRGTQNGNGNRGIQNGNDNEGTSANPRGDQGGRTDSNLQYVRSYYRRGPSRRQTSERGP